MAFGHRLALAVGAMALAAAWTGGAAAGDVNATIAHCESCHGPRGDSTAPDTPRLNGQHAQYLSGRLKNFLDPGHEDPHATDAMWGVVRNVDDATLAAVAAYFAIQTPTQASPADSPLALEGQKLFAKGEPSRRIEACQSCHGVHGEGAGAVPRLAGQHGLYLQHQMERLRLGMRASDRMHPNANSFTDQQIAALVAFLAKD